LGSKLLVVAWDSADRDLVDRWSAEGRLPTLARLRASGVWSEVRAADAFGDDAAWASFSTGAGLDVHARSYWQRIAPGGRSLRYAPREETSPPPFWEALANAGARVALVDVPSQIGEPRDALVVADWTAHALERPTPRVSWPDLAPRIIRDPDWACDLIGRNADQTRDFVRQLATRAELRGDVLVDALVGNDWDLFVAVFSEPHCVGHQCWHDHDPTHAEHDAARRAECGDPIEQAYRNADTELERLVDAAGPDAAVIVFSLLGMGPNYSGEHLLDEMLLRVDGSNPRPTFTSRVFGAATHSIPDGMRRHAPAGLRRIHRRAAARDAARRTSWVVPTDLATSAIRVGVAGRDAGGTVEPGAPLAAHRSRLADELRSLDDPATGRPVVDDVVDVRLVHGPRPADEFADLMVVWSEAGPITAMRSPSFGTVRGAPPPLRTGNHRPRGWVVVNGASLDRDAVRDGFATSDLARLVAGLLARSEALSLPPPGRATDPRQ
jgi:predicted AlkP superfamily phosphohydrolase/phosphomutase